MWSFIILIRWNIGIIYHCNRLQGIFINWFVGASSIYQARGKFDEHESSVGVAQGAANSNSSLLKLSKCFSFSMCISFCQLCISQDMNHLESLKSA